MHNAKTPSSKPADAVECLHPHIKRRRSDRRVRPGASTASSGKLEITAVPTMFFSDGDRIDGSRSANEMNAKFKSYSLGVDDAIVTVNRLMRDSQLATDRTTIMRSQTTPPSNAAPADARGEQAKPTTRPARVPADLCDPCAMAVARMQMPGGCPYRENPCAAPPTDGNGRTSR